MCGLIGATKVTNSAGNPVQTPQDETTWYLAQIKPNCHIIAERNLRRQGFQTFHPMLEETRRKSEKFASALRPLFAGYMFVALDTAVGGWGAVNSTHGVTRLVSFGDGPQAVPLELISGLVARCDGEGRLLPPPALRPGDEVVISGGPFADFTATVDAVSPGQRVWVLLDLMGRSTRIAVPPGAVQVV